jgi:hypothetical protein
MKARLGAAGWAMVWLLGAAMPGLAQTAATAASPTVSELEQEFFGVVREGDALKLLSYVPEDGVNVGRDAEHTTRAAIEEQLTHRTGLYCKLFDSACLRAGGQADACSYREILTQSEKVRTASTETTRNHVRQAILVAQVQNQKCGGAVLVDFIFNFHQGGWKLFSIP